MEKEERRNVILNHYKNPFNKKEIKDSEYITLTSKHDSCIDNIILYIKLNNNIIEDISFEGEACAICIASTSIMVKNVINKDLNYVKEYLENFEKMLKEEKYDETNLGDANAFNDIGKNNARNLCALLPYKALKMLYK